MRSLLFFIGTVLATLALSLYASSFRRSLPAHAATNAPGPIIDSPEVIDIGEQEQYSLAVARFTVANRGSEELVLRDVRSGCACLGLDQERDGQWYRSDVVRVPASESRQFGIRQIVHGSVGDTVESVLYYRTNDPAAPERQVRVRVAMVNGGVSTFPKSVVFGSVPLGGEARARVDVYDEATTPRVIDRVVVDRPEAVTVRLLPPDGGGNGEGHKGRHLARLEATLNTQSPGQLNGQVLIYLAGRTFPTTVPVTATIASPVEIVPGSIQFPRRSESGLMYSTQVVCRATDGRPLSLQAGSVPSDLSVRIAEGEPTLGPVRVVHVKWDPAKAESGAPPIRTIRLIGTVEGADYPIDLNVICHRAGGT